MNRFDLKIIVKYRGSIYEKEIEDHHFSNLPIQAKYLGDEVVSEIKEWSRKAEEYRRNQ